MTRFSRFAFAVLLIVLAVPAFAQWKQIGPDGGDVRALAQDPFDPDRILLGTTSGRLYISHDAGESWSQFVHLGESYQLVLDNIAFDHFKEGNIYVAAWSLEENTGDIYRSQDGGQTWHTLPGMHGKSVRALALAPSMPGVLVAGALDGVYRSVNGGDSWQKITPDGHIELKNIESVAIDPVNTNIIYAGTWHLPWKTTDGGATWNSIKKGMIDDSDVFSIVVDYSKPSTVFASACSGIYKSENGGELFRKIQGMPFSARRTRVLRQDPKEPGTVYAGTTEGLWKTVNSGASWTRITSPQVVVNDVAIDPRDNSRFLVATDRGGILLSRNAGKTFAASNRGFSHRNVASLMVDRENASVIYAGTVSAREQGGVFVSNDAGASWGQISTGLNGADVFVMRQTDKGKLLAGTDRGLFEYSPQTGRWRARSTVVTLKPTKVGKKTINKTVKSDMNWRVEDLHLTPARWYAATARGLYESTDNGESWQHNPLTGTANLLGVSTQGSVVVTASSSVVHMSVDGGNTWYAAKLPDYLGHIYGLTLTPEADIWLASRQGAFRSSDRGDTWEHVVNGIPALDVTVIHYDERTRTLLAAARGSRDIYRSSNRGTSWETTAVGIGNVRNLAVSFNGVFAATSFDGVVTQNVPSPAAAESVTAGSGGGAR